MTPKTLFHTLSLLCMTMAAGWLNPASAYGQEAGEEVLQSESGLYYTIEKGDTLWDISKHFYDSPWVWPDLWHENDYIGNPHWIYPGERIRIFGREGTESIAKTRPPSEPLPKVQPQEAPYYLYADMDSIGFVREVPVTPWGTIFKVKEDKVLISEGDVVYVRPAEGVTFVPGDRFTVYRTFDPVRDPQTRAPIGVQHYIVGVIEMTDVAPEFSMGKVIQSFRHIELRDLLMPYETRSPKITLTDSEMGLKGKIIVAEEREEVIGDLDVVFIDKGRKDRIKVGQAYSVYYQDKESFDCRGKDSILLAPVDFGKILILHTEDTTATALVTAVDKAIQPGATIRTPSP
jgi:hypothetical protein